MERVNWKLISETRIHSFVYLFRVKTNVSAEGLLRFVISIEFDEACGMLERICEYE